MRVVSLNGRPEAREEQQGIRGRSRALPRRPSNNDKPDRQIHPYWLSGCFGRFPSTGRSWPTAAARFAAFYPLLVRGGWKIISGALWRTRILGNKGLTCYREVPSVTRDRGKNSRCGIQALGGDVSNPGRGILRSICGIRMSSRPVSTLGCPFSISGYAILASGCAIQISGWHAVLPGRGGTGRAALALFPVAEGVP